jgi:hypothetical protein
MKTLDKTSGYLSILSPFSGLISPKAQEAYDLRLLGKRMSKDRTGSHTRPKMINRPKKIRKYRGESH